MLAWLASLGLSITYGTNHYILANTFFLLGLLNTGPPVYDRPSQAKRLLYFLELQKKS